MSKKHFETEAIRTQIERTEFLEHSAPLYLSSSFVFEDAEDMMELMDMLLAKKRSGDRKTWLESKGNMAEVVL